MIEFEFKIDVSLQHLNSYPMFSHNSHSYHRSNMTMVPNNQPPGTASFLSRLMEKTSAGANDVIRFVFDDRDEALLLLMMDATTTALRDEVANVNVGGRVDDSVRLRGTPRYPKR